jgi:hypothetical protein
VFPRVFPVACSRNCERPQKSQKSGGIPGVLDGRGGRIRTSDPLLPKQMRYQAALRPAGRNLRTPLPARKLLARLQPWPPTGLVERLTRGTVHVDGARPGRSIFSPSARCVRPELVEDRAGRRRTMRADRYEHAGVVAHCGRPLLRPVQLRRRAAPEQVGRRRGEHGHVEAECPQLRPHLVKADVQEMSIEQQHLVNARLAAPSCSRARAAGRGRDSRRRCCLRGTSAD